MKALVHLVWEEGIPDCTRCAHDPGLRVEFGCDEAPAPKELYAVSCSACGGGRAPDCPACGGKGEVPMFRCPRKLSRDSPDVETAFRAFQEYLDHGVLPAAGGVLEQTSGVFQLFGIARAEKALLDRERAKKEDRERMRQEKLAGRGAGAAGVQTVRGKGRASKK